MPCWYYERHELINTPSYRDGLETETESRYRREGARFIMDVGAKLGLRYDSCATGVVYFQRFYMFHSFREFNRYVMGACCLFLAGKVEETPKKCKNIVKMAKTFLTEKQFAIFGEDPKEEVMTMERVLLQTIKFDLQVEHPYAYLLKFAKYLKGDKEKVQKMVQMGWTFVNDSMCTMLCLQWEPDIISVALIYLACRLTKYDITDWQGKQPGFRGKWWDGLVEDVSLELLEDICHQVLDLYSSGPSSQSHEESPPPAKPQQQLQRAQSVKRSRPATPQEQAQSAQQPKVAKLDNSQPASKTSTPASATEEQKPHMNLPPHTMTSTQPQVSQDASAPGYSRYNPYMTSQMYSSSFMSQKGAESIQSLIGGGGGGGGAGAGTKVPPPNYPPHPGYPPQGGSTSQYHPPPPQQSSSNYPPQQSAAGYPPQSASNYPPPQPYPQQQYPQQPGYNQNFPSTNVPPPGYAGPPSAQGQAPPSYPPHQNYPPPQHQSGYGSNPPYPQNPAPGGQQPYPQNPPPTGQQQYPQKPPQGGQQQYQQNPPPGGQFSQRPQQPLPYPQHGQAPPHPQHGQAPPHSQHGQAPPPSQMSHPDYQGQNYGQQSGYSRPRQKGPGNPPQASSLAVVRITGRR